jgi:hypothetical protein
MRRPDRGGLKPRIETVTDEVRSQVPGGAGRERIHKDSDAAL